MKSSEPLKTREMLFALAIFGLPAISLIFIGTPQWTEYILGPVFLATISGAIIYGALKGFPGWSLLYLGSLLVGGIFLGPFWRLWEMIYPYFTQLLGPMQSWSLPVRVLYQGLMAAFLWYLVLLAALVIITLLRLWPRTRRLWYRIREDWTQLSFLVYGGVVCYIFLIFDEYQYANPWKFAALSSLAIGCWIYLRGKVRQRRIMALLCSVTLAMWIIAVGKWLIVPLQDWPVWFQWHPPETERWFAAGSTLAGWVCIVAAIIAPALLNLAPPIPQPPQQEELTPA